MSTNIRAALITGTAALLASGAHGAVVTSWSFNTAATSADLGNGEANAIETSVRTVSLSKKKPRKGSTQVTNRALEVLNFDADASRSGYDGISFATDTNDFQDLSVSFLQLNGARSSAWAQFQYSIDGGVTFITTGLDDDGKYRVAASKNFTLVSFDLSGITEASNNADFQFRVMAIHAPDMDKFLATSGKRYAATGNTATWKFDEVTVNGSTLAPANVVPAPGAFALLMAAGTIATGARRRKS
jgi:hypothetical protein